MNRGDDGRYADCGQTIGLARRSGCGNMFTSFHQSMIIAESPASTIRPDSNPWLATRDAPAKTEPMHDVDFKAQRFLVTGGAGFLGSHVCEQLKIRGVSELQL